MANDTFINFINLSFSVQQNLPNTSLIHTLLLDSLTSDSMLFAIYGNDILSQISDEFGFTDETVFLSSMNNIGYLATLVENQYNLNAKTSLFQDVLFSIAFENIIYPNFYNATTENYCYNAIVNCYRSAKRNYFLKLLRAGAQAIISPLSGGLALALAVADYAGDLEDCNQAYIDCR